MLSLNDYGSVWTQCDMDGFQIVGPPPSQMTTLILYLSDQLTACPSPWKRPSHPQGHTYCPPALPGHCPRNMSLSVCTWKSKAQVMSPLLTRVHYNWKPWPFTFSPSSNKFTGYNQRPSPAIRTVITSRKLSRHRQLISEKEVGTVLIMYDIDGLKGCAFL